MYIHKIIIINKSMYMNHIIMYTYTEHITLLSIFDLTLYFLSNVNMMPFPAAPRVLVFNIIINYIL
jgi:hypothetical protein